MCQQMGHKQARPCSSPTKVSQQHPALLTREARVVLLGDAPVVSPLQVTSLHDTQVIQGL